MSPIRATCICADARRPGSYEELLGGEHAQLLLTDPPYCLLARRRAGGDLRGPRRGKKIDDGSVRRFQSVRDYVTFTAEWLSQALRHVEGESPLVIWTNPLGRQPIASIARTLGFVHVLGEFVWAKRAGGRPGTAEEILRVGETALVLGRHPPPEARPGDPATVWSIVAGYDDDGEAARWGAHPNHKPCGVLEPLLRQWSRPGQLVLDPFAGSGSIGAAAVCLGRRAACLEIEPLWATLAARRLALAATRA